MSKQQYELEQIAGNIRPRNDKNVRPGDRMGLDIKQVQNYIKRQKRCKGESYALATGDNTDLAVQLPGTARVWLGFVFSFSAVKNVGGLVVGNVSLVINNEVVIENVFVDFYGKDFTDEEYYFIPRPLSGQDDIRFTVKGVEDTYTLNVNSYYL